MAVYTKLSEANIKKIIQNYKLDELLNYKGIKEGIENTNYLLVTKTNKFIITIFEKRVDLSQIPFFFEVMINSHSAGIECPIPIKDKNGEYVNIIKNKKMALFVFLEGNSKNNWTEDDCFKVGEKLARFHSVNKTNLIFNQNSFGLNFWKKNFNNISEKLKLIIPDSYETIRQEINFISSKWPNDLPKGVIHADLFPDNVFFKKTKISGFLDFYFSCNDFLAYDLAVTVNAWCFRKNQFKKTFFYSLVSGYESIRKLTSKEKDNFNILLRGAALRFLFTRINDSMKNNKGKLVKKKDPYEFFQILDYHIKIKSRDFYFE